MLFIVRARRSQNRQQLRCSAVPPPCKQVSHRSPSQLAPGIPPASWPCAGTGVKTQSPAQKATTVAGLAHHMLSQQLQTPQPAAATSSLAEIAGAATGRWREGVARANDTTPSRVSIGSQGRSKQRGGAKESFLSFPNWRVRTTEHAVSLQRAGRDALTLFSVC